MDDAQEKIRKLMEEHERQSRERIQQLKQDSLGGYSEYANNQGSKYGLDSDGRELTPDEIIEARDSIKRSMIISKLRPIIFMVGALMASMSMLMIWKPETYLLLTQNVVASALGLLSVLMFLVVMTLSAVNSARERTFVDIDDKLYNTRIEFAEHERDEAFKKIRDLQLELALKSTAVNEPHSEFIDSLSEEHRYPHTIVSSFQDSQGFSNYLKSVIRSLDMSIELADNKASLLLDKGTSYLWRGIVFYVLSIVVWQVATAYFEVGEYAVWGMISCSMTFLVVEFLAAWFLRQYKSFIDSSFNLVRVKSVFNRYLLSYLTIKEFSDSDQHLVDMRTQMLKVLEEDIKWLEPGLQKAGDVNHMIAMFESVSGLVEKLRVPSKPNSTESS